MLRKLVCAMFFMTVAIGMVMAEEFQAQVTKIDGDKVTLQKYKKADKAKGGKGGGIFAKGEKDGDEVTMPLAKDAKISKGKFDPESKKFVAGDALEGGLKADFFKIDEKKGGPMVRVTTNDDKQITEIVTTPFGGGGFLKDKGKKDAPPKDAPAKDAKDK